jgi:DNA-binding transcriptional MocR family regulator
MSRAPYVSIHVPSALSGRRPSTKDVITAFSQEIEAGRLPSHSRLPPVRVLERQLGLSKNTVQVAYDELAARGLVVTREREGAFVAERLTGEPASSPANPPPVPQLRPPPLLFGGEPAAGMLRLSMVFIDPSLLPTERFADCMRSVLRTPGLEPFYDAQGYPPLRQAIAQRLALRGMDVRAENVVVTVGSQQALDIVCRTLEVRRLTTEDPVYPTARLLFASHALAVTGLPLDPFVPIDFDLWELRLRAHRPGLFYAITSFQNPTGYSYSTSEIQEVCELAHRHGFALLEDDWGSDMLSDSEYRPSLRLMGGENVLYVNSFTKKILPSLRIGFVVARADQVPSLVAIKRLSTLASPPLMEGALAEFLDRGYYDTHLTALQRELDVRYELCLATLRDLMPAGVRWTTPGGGPTLWLDLPRSVDLGQLRGRMAKRHVHVEDASFAFQGSAHLHGFRIGYAFLPPADLRRGLEILSEELRLS